jgi:hypothetical protein
MNETDYLLHLQNLWFITNIPEMPSSSSAKT